MSEKPKTDIKMQKGQGVLELLIKDAYIILEVQFSLKAQHKYMWIHVCHKGYKPKQPWIPLTLSYAWNKLSGKIQILNCISYYLTWQCK